MTIKNRDVNSDWIFGSNPNMTKGNNDTCVSILCHSRAQTRESRNEDIMPLDSRIKYENDNVDTIPLDTRVKHEYDNKEIVLKYDNEESSCHSGLRAGIQRDDNLMPKAFRFAQSGRSMVEMLGVLAVIGVLSIGGIAGYSYGMDRWRANTTLNDVHLRMVDVMTQVFRGQTDIALSEEWPLTGQAGYVIDLFQNIDSEPSIMVESVPSSVCKIILKNTPDTQDIFVGTKSGEGVDGAWYTGDNDSICDGDEKEMLFALNEDVLGNMDETGAGCQADSDCSADKPYCDTDSGVCHECNSNDDCGAGYFCADSNESASKATPYTCKSLNFSTVDLTNEEGITETWHYSNEPMSWWDTKMACEAMDLRMPTLSELSSGNANSAGNYKIVRPHIKTLYNLIKKSNNPSILITGCHTYLGIDGWMPNCNQKPYNLLTEPTYGVCKE